MVLGVQPRELEDPGDGGVLPTAAMTGYINLESGGVETRTLPDPTFVGQEIGIFFTVDGGNATVTADSPIDQAGDTSLVFADVGDHIHLVGHHNPTDGWEWRVVCNDGVALS